jgi:hypothetical protein
MEMVVSWPLLEEAAVARENALRAAPDHPAVVAEPRDADRGNHGARGIDQIADRHRALVPGFARPAHQADEAGCIRLNLRPGNSR